MIGLSLLHLRTLSLTDEDGDAAGSWTRQIAPGQDYDDYSDFDEIVRDINYSEDGDPEDLFEMMSNAGMKWEWTDTMYLVITDGSDIQLEELGRL